MAGRADTGASSREEAALTTNDTTLRFLVVDDDADIRNLLVRMVAVLGHQAVQAGDGFEAVEAVAVEDYDYMLLDLTMPRMTGQEVLLWLRRHPQRAEGLRVVVVSAWVTSESAELEALGAYAVLPKPLRLQQLRDLVGSAAAQGARS